jgi:hypothetical protein
MCGTLFLLPAFSIMNVYLGTGTSFNADTNGFEITYYLSSSVLKICEAEQKLCGKYAQD